MQIATKQQAYKDGDTNLNGVFFWDESQTSKRPGVVVVHGGAGLDDHAKNRARRFAELGYVAFACDMYGEGVAGSRELIMACINELRAEPERLPRRAIAGIGALKSHPLTSAHIAAVGYCFGGMAVLELALSGAPIAGIVSVHGSLDTQVPRSRRRDQCENPRLPRRTRSARPAHSSHRLRRRNESRQRRLATHHLWPSRARLHSRR